MVYLVYSVCTAIQFILLFSLFGLFNDTVIQFVRFIQ